MASFIGAWFVEKALELALERSFLLLVSAVL
jgi:hypothetical protein